MDGGRLETDQLPGSIWLDASFLTQAPNGDWNNPRFQDGCEEAALIMAWRWVRSLSEDLSDSGAREEILAMSFWQEEHYGHYIDSSANDTAQLFKDYYLYDGIQVKTVRTVGDIKQELARGKIVITPVDGRAIGNPYYTPPGPERHMIMVIGYDDETREFITNDAGTKRGKGLRYDYQTFFNAIRDYLTGNHAPITEKNKVMIVVDKL